ncbi:MAG: putative Ig domain-containing protein [Halioglobus sp.]
MPSYTRSERFLSLFTTLRAGEGRSAYLLCAQSFLIMLAYYLLKVIREPLILADGSAELKAYTTAVQAFLLMFIVPVFARLYQRASSRNEKHHLFRNSLLFFLLNLVAFGVAYKLGWHIGIVFYVWLGIFSVMVLALFWAFAADLFNLKSGQRIFPLIAASSALGALLGSGLAGELYLRVDHDGVIYCAALLLAIPWWLSARTEHCVPADSKSHVSAPLDVRPYPFTEGFQVVWRNRYLTLIAGFVILLNLINTNGEYILATFVTEQVHSGATDSTAEDYITLFYSKYLFLTTLISFLIQLFLVSRIFDRIGIAGALYILPILMLINYSLIALIPILAVARAALIAENSVYYSLQTTTRHALFLPVNRQEKYVGKHTIDTFLFRLGDVFSGGFVYLASAVIGLGIVGFVMINIILATALLYTSRAIGRGHHTAAAEHLSNRPPVLITPLQDLSIPAGQSSQLDLAADTFVDNDVGDALRYQAYLFYAQKLPNWIKFDGLNQRFEFNPPRNIKGSSKIRVVARDFEGLEAESSFTLTWGP